MGHREACPTLHVLGEGLAWEAGVTSCSQEGHRATSTHFSQLDMGKGAGQIVARARSEGRGLACHHHQQPRAGAGLGVWGPATVNDFFNHECFLLLDASSAGRVLLVSPGTGTKDELDL